MQDGEQEVERLIKNALTEKQIERYRWWADNLPILVALFMSGFFVGFVFFSSISAHLK